MVKVADIRLDSIADDKIRRYFGYDDEHQPSERTVALMDDAKAWLGANANPRGVYGVFPCALSDERTVVIGPELFESRVFRMHLEGARACAVMAVTMGPEVDAHIKAVMDEGNMAYGYVLNGMAAASTDCAADAVESVIRRDLLDGGYCAALADGEEDCIQPGWKLTLRYSPGYADFILENQRAIFDLLKPERVGMKLTASYLMIPMKSITAIIGIGPDVVTDAYPCKLCDVCNITNCKYV